MVDDKKSKVLTAALSVFLRYGFKRVNMNDIADAAGVSRAALYLLFKNKEDIFVGVFLKWVDETISNIKSDMDAAESPQEKIERAFEIWAVRPFEMVMHSPEAKELVECSFDFAQDSLRQGYSKFEEVLVPALASLVGKQRGGAYMTAEKVTHVLVSAVRGFKQTANTPDELRQLIKELLLMSFSPDKPGNGVRRTRMAAT
jgi:AcrR family transcriptional regulator